MAPRLRQLVPRPGPLCRKLAVLVSVALLCGAARAEECGAGQYDAGGACALCPSYSFKAAPGNASALCVPCAQHSLSSADRTTCECIVAEATFDPDAVTCRAAGVAASKAALVAVEAAADAFTLHLRARPLAQVARECAAALRILVPLWQCC